ncbi:MAG TPA: mycothiol synthase [Micromonosporaceae bacterium]|nr:mycothiol synthase [Micromonosporaceae bacterium]
MGSAARIVQADHLTPDQIADVLALTRAASDADGVYPLSEHVTLHLRHGGDAPAVHLLAYSGDELVGYGHVDTTDAVSGPSAELCVHPLHRRRGLGRALVLAAMAAADERDPAHRLRLWAHGDHPSANALALSLGFDRTRVLYQMRRSLLEPIPPPKLPEGVRLRSFRPGEDDERWLALNARAFADHPEQGRWTMADFKTRMAEDWFDPDGFLLAERIADGALLGFHWTKVHGSLRRPGAPEDAQAHGEHQHDPIGEVYVLGVDPAAHGMGLGTALTLAGLAHLRGSGLSQVMLYVDETNTAALRLYQRLGFARWATDVSFQRSASVAS